jgi:hypothetical protein
MALRFGVFDHIEPVPGLGLDRIYRERLLQIERLDAAGFHAYHLAEHHTPAIHSLAPSQNVFLAAVAQRTRRLRFGPCVYVLPCTTSASSKTSMPDNLSDGRLRSWARRGDGGTSGTEPIQRSTTSAARRSPSSAKASPTGSPLGPFTASVAHTRR